MERKNKTVKAGAKVIDYSSPVSGGPSSPDPVNHPTHYNFAGIECIDAIRAALGPEAFRDYMMGNVMKYSWRYKYKNGVEDLKKAQWYLNRTIEELDKESGE